jgi:hypothetical protein
MTLVATAGRLPERRYFVVVWLGLATLVATGFAKSCYLRSLFSAPPLTTLVHVHGAVMTAWVVLLGAQIALIVARRPAWHRRLGWWGIGVAALVVALGCAATLTAAAREVAGHTAQAPAQLTILGLELTQMLLFATLAGLAIRLRRRLDVHKRLMILATVCLLPSPISRLPISFGTNAAILMWFDLIVVVVIVADAIRERRLHPAYGWGATLLLGGLNGAYVTAYSPAWHQVATWLVS